MGAKQRLKEFLNANDITQAEFTSKIGVSHTFLSVGENIGSDKLAKIMKEYDGIDIEYIVTGVSDTGKNILIDKTSKFAPDILHKYDLEKEMLDSLVRGTNDQEREDYKMSPKMSPNVSPNEQKEPNIKTFALRTDRNLENQRVPLYDLEAVAGLVPLFTGKAVSEPEDFIQIPHLPKCDGAVYVTGDSMYPLLKSGDMVMYKEVKDIKNDIFFGEMYLLSLDMSGEEYVTVKFVQRSEQDGYVTLVSHNSHHQPKEVRMDKIKALALVKASIRINSMN